mmetsp:Transcript_124907/g.400090  ORF Transcript_124907/g.400090 Transcript_124907/m.400090 type:complete len:781 (+) Transcript_124907:123-2465(+)
MAPSTEVQPPRRLPAKPHRCEGCPGGPLLDRGKMRLQEEQDHVLGCFFDSLRPTSGGASGSAEAPPRVGGRPLRMHSEAQWDDFKLKLKDRGLLDFEDLELLGRSPLAAPPESFPVSLDKPRRGRLLTPVDSRTLEVGEIHAGCVFAEWNRQNPSWEVQPGDRIRKVNGKERVDEALAALEERGRLDVEIERPGLDAAGLQRWLSQRAWGDALQRFDQEAEAMRGALHSVNIAVGYRGIENLSRDELYMYQVLLGEYEHKIAAILKTTLSRARVAETAAGGPFLIPEHGPVPPTVPQPTPPPMPPPAESVEELAAAASGEEPATPAAPVAKFEAPLPTTPEEFQWTRGPEIERRLRELRVPAVAFPPGAPALERTLWGLRRVAATAVNTGEEVEVLEVPWDVPPDCADYVVLITNRLEALKQLALSSYFPDYLGCDLSSYAGVGLHFLRRKQGVSLRHLVAIAGPLPEQHPLLRYWARELLLGLRDYLCQCCQELTEDITLASVYIHQEGTRVLFQGVPFGDRRGTLFEDLPEYGPDNKWCNGFEAVEARLSSMFGVMLMELLGGEPPPGIEAAASGQLSFSEGVRSLLAQALNAPCTLDASLGQLPGARPRDGWAAGGGWVGGASARPKAKRRLPPGPADAWVGLAGGFVAAGIDEFADGEEYRLWWIKPARRKDIPPIMPNTERSVDEGSAAFEAEWAEDSDDPDAHDVKPQEEFVVPWLPNAEPSMLQALLDNEFLQGPQASLPTLMEAWHVLSSRYEASVNRARLDTKRTAPGAGR